MRTCMSTETGMLERIRASSDSKTLLVNVSGDILVVF